MSFKELPINELPRERLLKYGRENLSNIDLLSIILRTGVKNLTVREVSENILKKVGSINNLSNISVNELSNIKGVGYIKAITLLASIELGKRVTNKEIILGMSLNNSKIIHDTFKSIFKNQNQENFLCIYLDNKKRLISYKILFIGTNNKSVVHPREIYKEAIKANASSIICIHNHPSNDLTPSKEDINITEKLKECGNIIGIELIDHLITNGEEYFSFYDSYKIHNDNNIYNITTNI